MAKSRKKPGKGTKPKALGSAPRTLIIPQQTVSVMLPPQTFVVPARTVTTAVGTEPVTIEIPEESITLPSQSVDVEIPSQTLTLPECECCEACDALETGRWGTPWRGPDGVWHCLAGPTTGTKTYKGDESGPDFVNA